MKALWSFIVMIVAIVLFIMAMPYLGILFLIMLVAMIWLSNRTRRTMNQAKKDINDTWNQSGNSTYDDTVEKKKNSDVIDVEYEERDVEDK